MHSYAKTSCLIALALIMVPSNAIFADETLKDIACRSVHLGFKAPEGVAFYNQVTVDQSAPGTYFSVCAFGAGYYGLQELGNGKKVLIFSIWDPTSGDDPAKVDPAKRVKLVRKDDAVRVGRFGNEGTGGQSFLDFDWKVGETYQFLMTAKVNGDRTEFSASFFMPDTKTWKELATFSTLNQGKCLDGYYSFVEDFKRDRVSATKVRSCRFGPGWVKEKGGKWTPLRQARFTADANPVLNINAGVREGAFFLATGGDTKNTDTKLNATIDRSKLAPAGEPPASLIIP